jgi:hypothetical protein
MRVVLADLKSAGGLVSKDTVVGGYGSRSKSFTRVTGVLSQIKWRFQVALSVQMAELAAMAAASGHEVVFTRGESADDDVAVVLSSLVDYRHETAWADAMRAQGIRTGFVGLAASNCLPVCRPCRLRHQRRARGGIQAASRRRATRRSLPEP